MLFRTFRPTLVNIILTKLALRPDDPKIHKFAGKLLFENGAFEDAIKAFSHDTVEPTI